MNRAQEDSRLEIRRILVTLDDSFRSIKRVETAVELAASLKAELIGLFVEDANLLRIAELPFAREIGMFSPVGRQIRLEQLHWELRAHSERMRRALASAAADRKVPWEFKVARGPVVAEVLAAAMESDLMIVGRKTWTHAGARRLGSTVRMILTQGQGMTLIIQEHVGWSTPVSLVFDGSELSFKALNVAAHLAQIREGRLSVFIVASDREAARTMQARVFSLLANLRLDADFRLLINPSVNTLAWLVQTHGSGPVVLPCSGDFLEGEGLCSLVSEVTNPVLLVR
jgi:nucleotide-binding universal stress UspA family protein